MRNYGISASRVFPMGLVIVMCASAHAQIRPATEAEIELMKAAVTLGRIPEWSHREVLDVQGTFTRSPDRPARLDGWVTFEPYEVPYGRCLMEAGFVTGVEVGGQYAWRMERFAYWNPDAGPNRCEVEGRSRIPERAVQSSEPIPSAAMAFILANSGKLLTLAYEYAESAEIGEAEPARTRILDYREDGAFAIDRVGITGDSEAGLAYSATYRAPGRPDGPAVIFSVTQSGFVIHDVGLWTP